MELDELIDDQPKKDFRRANGAPMVSDPERPDKTLRYSRPSGWGKDLDDESALVTWKVNKAIIGVAHHPALRAKIVAAGEDKSALKDLREEAINLGKGNEASDIGTALHAMSQRYDDPNDEWIAPEPYGARLAQYADIIQTAGLVPEYVEVQMVNDPMRCAGTADRIYRTTRPLIVPDGTIIDADSLIMADLKTGRSLEYSIPGYAVQLALYADGEFYDIEHDKRIATPFIHPQWGLIVHLPAEGKTCTLWWTNLEIGRTGARLVRDVRAWRKRHDHVQNFNYPDEPQALAAVAAIEEPAVLQVAPFALSEDGWKDMDEHRAIVLEEMTTWIKERVAAIGLDKGGRSMLLRRWPEGINPIKHGGHTMKQLEEIDLVVASVERDLSFTFTTDPRTKYKRGHKTEMKDG